MSDWALFTFSCFWLFVTLPCCLHSDYTDVCAVKQKLAVFAAIYNFVGNNEHKLSFDVGDAVNVICQSEGSKL